MQGEAEQNGEQQHLQNIAAGESADDAAGDHVQQEGDHALLFRLLRIDSDRFGVQRRRIDVHARAGLNHINHDQADNQRNGADHFKVEQRHRASAPDRLHAFHSGDAGHHGAENYRRDNHFDQFYKGVAQRFHLRAQLRVKVTEQNTDGDGGEDLKIKAFEQRCFHKSVSVDGVR